MSDPLNKVAVVPNQGDDRPVGKTPRTTVYNVILMSANKNWFRYGENMGVYQTYSEAHDKVCCLSELIYDKDPDDELECYSKYYWVGRSHKIQIVYYTIPQNKQQ